MKFIELKKHLQTNTINNCCLLGNDAFLINKSLEFLKGSKAFEPEDLNVNVFSERFEVSEVIKALNTLPFMSEFKFVVLNVSGENDKLPNVELLVEYLKNSNENSIFVVVAGTNKASVEKLLPLLTVIDCNKLDETFVNSFIVAELKKYNKTITKLALKLLCEYTLFDLQVIWQEISKLVSYAGSESEITDAMVKEVVYKNIEFQIFDLTENLAKKNADKVMKILQEMKAKKEDEKMLLPLISSHFRRMFLAGISGGNFSDTATHLKVKEYAVKIAVSQSKLFKQLDLKSIFELCLQLDFKLKTGEMNFDNALNYLVLTILNL